MVFFIGQSPILLLAFQFFRSQGPLPHNLFQSFRSWGPPPKIWISGIRFKLRLHGNEGLIHISVSKFCNNLQPTSCTCYDLHRALSWAKWEECFFLSFFCRLFFGWKIWRSNLKFWVRSLQKKTYMDSFWQNTQIQKNN